MSALRARDSPSAERAKRESNRRARGLCVACGRPMSVTLLRPTLAVLECPSCATRVSTRPPSGLYRIARDRLLQAAPARCSP
jgi:hypothetical protein